MSAVYVWIETFNGQPNSVSWEALGAGRTLANSLSVPLVAVIFGENAASIAETAAQYGAGEAIVCDDLTLHGFRVEPYAALLTNLVQANQPKFVLAIGTSRGRELLAAAAADTDSGLLSEITAFSLQDDGSATVTRTAYAGKIIVEAAGNADKPQFLALRGRSFTPNPVDESRSATITTIDPVLAEDDILTKIETFEAETGSVSLTDAARYRVWRPGDGKQPQGCPTRCIGCRGLESAGRF